MPLILLLLALPLASQVSGKEPAGPPAKESPAPEKEILERLVPRYLETSLHRMLLESMSSEHSARMNAMRNATDNATFSIPPAFGRLVSVSARGEVQYLYFEGEDGAIRMVLIGPRGAIQRARTELQLLTPEVYLIKRGRENEPLPEPAPSAETTPKR